MAAEKWMNSDPITERVRAGVRSNKIRLSMIVIVLACGGWQSRMVWLRTKTSKSRISESGMRGRLSVQSPRMGPEPWMKCADQVGMEAEKAIRLRSVKVVLAIRVLSRPCQWRSSLCRARRRSGEMRLVNIVVGIV
jgi:hypothetical protein